MPFCPKCGTQADPSASFCNGCGNNLKSTQPREITPSSMKEKGGTLEDTVADYLRRTGFDVERRVRLRDRFDVSHEIDVLASKKEAFGTIRVAVECKYVKASMDIKEIRNFHDKLTSLGITKGIFVSTGGFTTDAESHAGALGIDLWDTKTLEGKLTESGTPEKDVIYDTLPVRLDLVSSLKPRHLQNINVLSETIELAFRPYYFIEYHCFSQHTVRGASALLESKGKVVIDAVSGQVADCVASVGQQPSIAGNGTYVSCSRIPPQTLTSENLPAQLRRSVVGHEVDSARAKEITKIELVKSLSLQAAFQTTRTKGTVLLKPRKKDIDILDSQGPVKIPFLFATYRFRNYNYLKQCFASTGAMTLDQTTSCLVCRNPAVIVCENCGALACESHRKACNVCGKNLCGTCAIAKGVISKKHYCTQHQPV